MPNVTISLDKRILEAGRQYAQSHGLSLNGLIRTLLARTVLRPSQDWVDELIALADRAGGDSRGAKWTRDDLYDV